jgi:uroporphyrinogen decarboxylase
VREALDTYAQFAAALTERIVQQISVDYACFSEPIGATHGPLISPRLFRETVLPGYRPILDVLTRHDVRTIVFRTYANARELLDDVLEAGMNTLWAVESESPDMDYQVLRKEYGNQLRLIGGIDLDVLSRGPDAIRRELEGKVPELVAQGGYIPLADGRVRPTVSFSNYRAYRELLAEIVAR